MLPQLHTKKFGTNCGLVCAAVMALFSRHARAQSEYDPDWTRNFRIGAMVGFNIKANFRTGGTLGVNKPKSGIYDDGYVLPDDTGDAGGYTGNWGYENGTQVSGSTLTMHRTDSFTAPGTNPGTGSDAPYLGLELAYGGTIYHQNFWRIGWELGAGILPIKISDSENFKNIGVTQSLWNFDTGGIVMPGAPYHGGFNSSAGEPSIHDHATAAGTQTSSDPANTLTGTRTLDVMLYTFRLGPTFYCDLTKRIGVQIGAGPALGLVTGDLKYDETLTTVTGGTSHNSGRVSSTDLTWGGYVNAMVTFHTVRNGDFYLGAQFMPMGTAQIGNSSRHADLNLTGQVYISAGVNWPF
jgi:hypothetical protein